ncbi:hypothetical protein Tco_0632719 [Tanacetum coccineum]
MFTEDIALVEGGSDRNTEYTLSKLLQMGTVAKYESEFVILANQVMGISANLLKSFYISRLKLELQWELFRSMPTTLGEAFSLARIVEARFEDERDRNTEYALSKLLQMGTVAEYESKFVILANRVTGISANLLKSLYISRHKPDIHLNLFRLRPTTLGEAFALARIIEARFEDERSAIKYSILLVDNGNGSALIFYDGYGTGCEVVIGLLEEFQEGDMVDALSRVLEQKSLENWKELDNESEDRKVERDAEREGEPNILAPFGSDRGITI